MIEACLVCVNTTCKDAGGDKILESLQQGLAEAGSNTPVEPYICFGLDCSLDPEKSEIPVVMLLPEGIFYTRVKLEDTKEIVGHILGGPPVERLRKTNNPELQKLIRAVVTER